MTIKTDNTRDDLLTDFGKATLSDRYLFDGETYQDLFADVAKRYQADDEHGHRIYSYLSRHWFMAATPILTRRGLPISCFLNSVADTMDGIKGTYAENIDLASNGGGIGTYWGNLRSIGEKVGNKGKTSGVIPFLKVQDSMTLAVSQGSIRRGSAAVYMQVSHPEIEEFVELRKPTGGDPNRRCLNLHHGVVVDDAFMEAVTSGSEYALRSPKTGEVIRSISARDLWIKMLTTRMEQGEVYFLFSDTVNRARPDIYKRNGLQVETSNLCVSGETRILTNEGYKEIASIAGTNAVLWSGEEWSESRVEKTADNARMRKIVFSNGAVIWATDEHKFYVHPRQRKAVEIRAIDLAPGDRIAKSDFPVIDSGKELEHAYTNGFHTADGTHYPSGDPVIWLYGEKINLAREVASDIGRIGNPDANGRVGVKFPHGSLRPKFFVPHGYSVKSKLEWLAGYLDGDGTVARNGDCETIQFSSCEYEFLNEVRLLLNTLGIECSVGGAAPERWQLLPDGHGGMAEYKCRPSFRSCITANGTQALLDLGLPVNRLEIKTRNVQRDAKRFVTVVSNGTEFKEGPTYCANEPKRHRIMLEGILTGNCNEIVLHTGEDHHGRDRTAVCCLSSLNLETYDQWRDDPQFIHDVMLFLDNVLQDFIDRAPDTMARAKYAAMRERSVGLGVMGWHTFLQDRGIPFESVMAKVWNRKIFRYIREQADAASIRIADVRGACPDAVDAGIHERFTHKLAVAPTASISIIAGTTSPGIDPITANVYLQKTLSGSFTVRNRSLERVLEAHGKNTPEVWQSITLNQGSVQHLDFLTDDEREVYKTAFEIDQRWVIEHAADRAPFICQGASTNLFLKADIHKRDLHEIHFQAWKKGVKGLYYCRSMSLQRAEAVSSAVGVAADNVKPRTEPVYEECLACS